MSGTPVRTSSPAFRNAGDIMPDIATPVAPGGPSSFRDDAMRLSRRIANLLDRAFPVNGSGARFGLDPIIGLIPGIGDAISAGLGSIIMLEAVRLKAPRPLILRMAGNIALNALIGAIPIVGDIFSFLFKSNVRNYALLHAWQTGVKAYPEKVPRRWLFAGCLGIIALVVGAVTLLVWLVSSLWHWFTL